MEAKKICYLVFGIHNLIGIVILLVMFCIFHAISIPKENRIYTQAKIIEISEIGDNHKVKAIVVYNEDDEKTVELNFYDSRMKKGDTIEVYYDKNNPSDIGATMMDDVVPYFYIIPGFFVVEGFIGVMATYFINKKRENV
ncbi:MAG: hypothetical protein IJ193_04385 [Bacilli bacterium]|nr:hypothetical protein [Bacilli bacterium]